MLKIKVGYESGSFNKLDWVVCRSSDIFVLPCDPMKQQTTGMIHNRMLQESPPPLTLLTTIQYPRHETSNEGSKDTMPLTVNGNGLFTNPTILNLWELYIIDVICYLLRRRGVDGGVAMLRVIIIPREAMMREESNQCWSNSVQDRRRRELDGRYDANAVSGRLQLLHLRPHGRGCNIGGCAL